MPDDIKQLLEEHEAKTKQHFDEKVEEVKSHMDVVAEDLRGEIKQVAEGVTANTERLELLEPMQKTLDEVKDDVEAIKTTLQGTETEKPLKQRVADMEAKVSTS